MGFHEFALFCAVAVIAALVGWLLAWSIYAHHQQGTIVQSPPDDELGADEPNPSEGLPRGFPSTNGEPTQVQSYFSIIEFPELDVLKLDADGSGDDDHLAKLNESVCAGLPQARVERTGDGITEVLFDATDEDEAVRLLSRALSLGEHALEKLSQSFKVGMRAVCVQLGEDSVTRDLIDDMSSVLLDPSRAYETVLLLNRSSQIARHREEIDTMRMLREAIRANEAELFYQPKFDTRDQTFRSAEALFRWKPPIACDFSVSRLIKSAERLNLIEELTLWSLRRAVNDQLELLEEGHELITYVNLSGSVLADSEFTLKAIEIIKGASGRIGLEITETSVIEHPDRALANLKLYTAAGAPIAIDDYGTGLSSLQYLKLIPASELKIDREFIRELTNSNRDPMIVRSTIDLAHALGMKVTAEGVDDPMKLALLKVMGCDFLQGFQIAKPMPLSSFLDFMRDTDLQEGIANPELSLLPNKGRRDASA